MGSLTIWLVIGWLMIAAGIIVSLIAALALFLRAAGRRRARGFRGGGLVMLGPIPIIFGTDKEIIKTLILLSIALIAIALAFIIALALLHPAL